MALFSRRKKDADAETPEVDGADAAPTPAEAGEPGVDRDWDRLADGPWDVEEFGDRDTFTRVDFGALRVAVLPGMQVRVEADKRTKTPVSITCVVKDSLVQLQVFAAPRRAGIWEDIRGEIAAGLVKNGGTSQEVEGPFGTELRARMPGRASDGRVAFQPARFVGIDGPRWFLRAVISGQGARDEQVARPLLALIRHTVVVRGDHPMPPRESLALTMPAKREDAPAEGDAEPAAPSEPRTPPAPDATP